MTISRFSYISFNNTYLVAGNKLFLVFFYPQCENVPYVFSVYFFQSQHPFILTNPVSHPFYHMKAKQTRTDTAAPSAVPETLAAARAAYSIFVTG